jgi:hypothetical protein
MISNRYPDADILGQQAFWDRATRDVVLDRVHNVPPFTFFDANECRTLLAMCERVIPQDHRQPDRHVPIAPWIDQRCQNRVTDGFRFDNMPPNEVAWRWGLAGLDETARAMFGQVFADLAAGAQDEVLRSVQSGRAAGATWQRMPAKRWWIYVAARQIAGIYYAHPFAWDEIGFGGPAYPRGYASLNGGAPEPWEAREREETDGHGHRRGNRP